jgi:hypothetical protein
MDTNFQNHLKLQLMSPPCLLLSNPFSTIQSPPRFDLLLEGHSVYKVETIGDCYMVAGGLVFTDAQVGACLSACVLPRRLDSC